MKCLLAPGLIAEFFNLRFGEHISAAAQLLHSCANKFPYFQTPIRQFRDNDILITTNG